MLRRRTALTAALVLAVASSAVKAHETDQYTMPPGREFADIGDYLTGWAYQTIDRAVQQVNADLRRRIEAGESEQSLTGPRCVDEIAEAVFDEFPVAYEVIEGLERKLRSSEWKARYPGQVIGHKTTFGQIYQGAHFPIDPRRFFKLWFASTIKAYGVYLGTDKVGHFTDMGYTYYGEYRKGIHAGGNEQQALRRAVRVGTEHPIFSESGVLGNISAGAYSNADLMSNYAGMLFYKNLTEPVKLKGELRPPMLVREGVYWKIAPHVRPNSDFFSWFFSDHFDEALNPSLFEWTMRGGMRRAVEKRADNLLWRYRDVHGCRREPRYFEALATELRTYWGDDYGHKGSADDLITIGKTCFEPVRENAKPDKHNPTGHTALHWAVATGNTEAVKRVLARKFSVDAPMRPRSLYAASEAGNTALHLAAGEGRVELVELLLSHGADVNAVNDWGATPLHRASSDPRITQLLISKGAQVDARDVTSQTPLHWTVAEPQSQAAAVLLDAGADAQARDHQGRSPLHLALRSGNEASVRELLETGADPNAADRFGVTPLHVAVDRPGFDAARLLLDRRANPDAADTFGYTPLHLAARHGRIEVAQALLERGAQPQRPDAHGSTPLHLACRHGNRAVADLLIKAGCDTNARNSAGSSPLHEAAFAGDRALVAMLLAAGANPKTADQRGITPAQVAESRRNPVLAANLRGEQAPAVYAVPGSGTGSFGSQRFLNGH